MKNLILTLSLILALSPWMKGQSDEPTGLPGDQFSLEGALEMFKKASSPEDFEKMLNQDDNHVNNLDLNDDGEVDYIRVIDNMDGDAHALVLQVVVSATENQDIAVIEIEKSGKESAMLQIIGDEDIFGESTIIEPGDGSEDANKIKKGPSLNDFDEDIVVVNVWLWPSVRYVYAPVYRPWVSPFRWAFYPTWYRPWRPLAWSVYHPFRVRYHAGYVVAPMHRMTVAHRVYSPVRVTSVTVRTRNHTAVNNYRVNRTKTNINTSKGNKEMHATKTTTSVTGKRGNTATKTNTTVSGENNRRKVKSTRSTTTVAGKEGKVKASRTKTKVSRKKN